MNFKPAENDIHVTRRETFNAAHRMYREEWSAEKNEDTFGKCANRSWHGHNYSLFVTVKGEVSYESGYLIDLKQLKAIMHDNVICAGGLVTEFFRFPS